MFKARRQELFFGKNKGRRNQGYHNLSGKNRKQTCSSVWTRKNNGGTQVYCSGYRVKEEGKEDFQEES